MRSFTFLALCAACSSSPSLIQAVPPPAPVTGPSQRFAVDQIPLTQATDSGFVVQGEGFDDVDGLIADLANFGSDAGDGSDQIRSGALAGSIVLTDGSDGQIGVSIDGAPQIRAVLGSNGAIATDELQVVTVPVQLPVLADADPLTFDFDVAQLQLVPDGSGGYTVGLQGLIEQPGALAAASSGFLAMLTNNPRQHLDLYRAFDANCDGVVTLDEIATNQFYVADTFEPEDLSILVDLPDGLGPQLAFGYSFHVVPCGSGSCVDTPVADHCGDRVVDGDETDVDCGGSCSACSAGFACGSDGDCDSRSCNDGTCAAPTCSDGIEDGFEDGVDLGGGCRGECE